MSRHARNNRPVLAPIAHAVRKALAASALLAALSAPAAGFAADACPAGAIRRCDAAIARDASLLLPLHDPALVAGDAVPVAVQALLPASDFASGIAVWDAYAAVLDNSADIAADAAAGGDARAYAGIAGSDHFSYLTNGAEGRLAATATSEGGTALAVGAYAYAGDSASLWNYGDIVADAASAYGDAEAYAAVVAGAPAGIGLLINGGDLRASAVVAAHGTAEATGAYVVANVGSIFNDASIDARAYAGEGGAAVARGAMAYAMYAATSNYGDVAADARGDASAQATGIAARGYYGATAYNAGTVEAYAEAAHGMAYAIGSSAIATVSGAYGTNAGAIVAVADGDSARATGMLNASLNFGNAASYNAGSIDVLATGGIAAYGDAEAVAMGVYSLAALYWAVVYNDGSISATAVAQADIAGTYGFLQAKALGVEAVSVYGYGDAIVRNGGDIAALAITSQGYASAWGAVAQTSGLYGGMAVIGNEGSIHAHAATGIGVASAIGVYARDQMGAIVVANHGDIVAGARAERGIVDVSVDYAYSTGVKATSYYGMVDIDNYGSIAAIASAEGAITGARGIQAGGGVISITNAEGASISAAGEVDLFGGGFATGIEANGVYAIDITNDGDIDVYGHAHAYSDADHGFYGAAKALGIYAAAGMRGDVAVTNNGAISAVALAEDSVSWAQGGAGATGINAYAKYDATIVNNGDIDAVAHSELGVSAAYGVIGHGKYSTSVVNQAGAAIFAEAVVGSQASDAYGGRAIAFGTHVFGNGMEYGVVYNAGSVVSHASSEATSANAHQGLASAWGVAIGASSNVQSAAIANIGEIEAAASADFGYATAYGSYLLAGTSATTSNGGSIEASALADHGNAWSVGSIGRAVEQYYYVPCEVVDGPYGPYNKCDYANSRWIITGGDAELENLGHIASVARAAGGVGRSYGAVMLGGETAGIVNSGAISAVAEAADAMAVGALANALYGVAGIDNSGSIGAVARGDIAVARGAHALGTTEAWIDNSGMIAAAAYGGGARAIAVTLESQGAKTLANTGTIAAFGDGLRIAVDASLGGGAATLSNGGTLVGAILAGDGDDHFSNAAGGTWWALGDSAFGAGDDAIANAGSLRMQDATIGLGDAIAGNAFDNTGTILANGTGNTIDMGGAFALRNAGTISLLDGATGDVLAVTGNLSGSGSLAFDVDVGAGAGDHLRLQGSVLASATQAIRVLATGVSSAATERIALVEASGTLGGTFTLAALQYPRMDFLARDFGLVRDTHTLWLETSVTGLDDTGTLAASVSSGVANFLNTQAGTFRQRLGVNPYGDAGKVMSAFVRMYTDEGDVEPSHVAANFGQGGHFGYDQASWGRELGVDANLWGNLHAGLVVGTADSRQRLNAGGTGTNRMDGMTWGAYATWYVPDGAYVDFSGRWMAVDVRSTSSAGAMQTRAHASSIGVEAGYAWSIGGFRLVPQLQYTRTEVLDVRALHGRLADFEAHGGSFERGRLGLEVNRTFEAGGARVTPYASLNAVREFDGESAYTVAGNFSGSTSVRGTSAMAELGIGVQKGGFGFSLGADWSDGGAYRGVAGAKAGIRYAW